jgi:DNA-binding GntR family transcriptional regulator
VKTADGRLGEETESLVDRLRRAITQGELLPNERLVEVELSERYRVGRAAVRTALQELTKERLVEHTQNRGAKVRAFSREEAVEVLEVRQIVEALCAERAARAATSEDIARLKSIVDQMKVAVKLSDLGRYSELNEEFHSAVREASHHAVASEIVVGLRNQTKRQNLRIAFIPDRPKSSVREHVAILEAITRKDPAAARAAMEQHLQSVIDVVASNPVGRWV